MGGSGFLNHRQAQALKYRVREKARWSPSLFLFACSGRCRGESSRGCEVFLNCDIAVTLTDTPLSVIYGKTRRMWSDAPTRLRADADSPAPHA
jgi:hypothetical protein